MVQSIMSFKRPSYRFKNFWFALPSQNGNVCKMARVVNLRSISVLLTPEPERHRVTAGPPVSRRPRCALALAPPHIISTTTLSTRACVGRPPAPTAAPHQRLLCSGSPPFDPPPTALSARRLFLLREVCLKGRVWLRRWSPSPRGMRRESLPLSPRSKALRNFFRGSHSANGFG